MSTLSEAQEGNNNNNNSLDLQRFKNNYLGSRLPLKARKESITLQKREDRISPDSSVSPEVPYHCSFCPRVFSEEHQINKHLQEIHKVLSPTRCPLCQVFVRDLAQHIALQHPQRLQQASLVTSSSADPIDLAKSSSPPSGRESPLDTRMMRIGNDMRYTERSSDSPPSPQNLLLRTTTEMLRAASSNSSNSSSPILGLAGPGRLSSGDSALPMNLSVRNDKSANINNNNNTNLMFNAGKTVARLLNGQNKLLYEHPNHILPTSDNESTSGSEVSLTRKRRKQTHVPDSNKDDRYWARRMKNNEAAKRSRDMRIKREKIVFEENSRLERENNDFKLEIERLVTDNKEVHLKLDLIMEENSRLKSLLLTYQAREEIQRKRMSGEYDHLRNGVDNHISQSEQMAAADLKRKRASVENSVDVKPFPFPDGAAGGH